jgi:uncharacterized protein involved in response to NO
MAMGNALIHLEILGVNESSASTGLDLVITVIVMMILIIAGRVFPFFTEKGLKGVIAIRNPFFDLLATSSSALVFVLLIFDVSGWFLALSATAAT